MHPAISVIFFTVMSGAGFGLMTMIGLGFPMRDGLIASFLVCLLGGGLAVAGLLSSTFHLGHPERAWRALSQWRSSWLSREGIAAIATLLAFALYSLIWMSTGTRIALLGWVVAIGSIATVYTTSMIYAQLKTVPNWHSYLTPVCYLAFSFASGLALAGAVGNAKTVLGISLPIAVVIALAIAWIAKSIWWKRADKVGFSETGSDTGTATGLGHLGKVKLLEKPHSGKNYLTKEMVHQIGRKHAFKLRMIAYVLGALVPVLLCLIALIGAPTFFLLLAAISLIAGLFAERWLFFAEAKHAVSLYY